MESSRASLTGAVVIVVGGMTGVVVGVATGTIVVVVVGTNVVVLVFVSLLVVVVVGLETNKGETDGVVVVRLTSLGFHSVGVSERVSLLLKPRLGGLEGISDETLRMMIMVGVGVMAVTVDGGSLFVVVFELDSLLLLLLLVVVLVSNTNRNSSAVVTVAAMINTTTTAHHAYRTRFRFRSIPDASRGG